MTKDKTNIEEIFIRAGLDPETDETANQMLQLIKDQVQAEKEQYLDEFVEYTNNVATKTTAGVYLSSLKENFKKEQREHE